MIKKMKRYMVVVNPLVLLFVMSPAFAQIEINDIDELQLIGNDPGYPLDGDYILGNDIDASATASWNSGAGFAPIGSMPEFTGTFDGQGYTITGLTINRPASDNVGLFGSTLNATIHNVQLENGNVTANLSVGMLAGRAENTVIGNCSTAGAVNGANYVGGLVGLSDSSYMTTCYNTSVITGVNYVGGLVGGAFQYTITTCYNTGAVSGTSRVGGLVGNSPITNTITTCYNTGAVSGNNDIGGLVGFADFSSTIATCYNMGTVTGSTNVGGLAGRFISGTITHCYWDTETSGISTSPVGGEGKTTAEMVQEVTFTNWDFVTVWDINEGCTYPFLQTIPNPVVAVPVTVSIEQAAPQPDPVTDTLPIVFEVVFNGPVTGFEASDVDFSASTATVAAWNIVGADGDATYTVEVTNVTTSGTVVASIPADAVTNACASNLASTSVDNSVTYYVSPYTIVEQAAAQEDPVETLPIQFDLLFAEPVTGLDSDDILVSGTATGVRLALEGSGMAYTVLVWDANSGGTITVSVPAGVCNAIATGIPNLASTSVDNTVLYGTPEPVPLAAWPALALLLAAGIGIMRRHKK